MSEDKTYLVTIVSSRGHESEHKFNAASRELAARSALVKYPYHHVKSVEEVMNYEEMSDFEINKLVAEKHLRLFVDVAKSKGKLDSDAWLIDSEGLLRWTNYNPCHDPKHAWPIIVENKINTAFNWEYEDLWTAFAALQRHESSDKNPLRAAMICFLKMKDAESGN